MGQSSAIRRHETGEAADAVPFVALVSGADALEISHNLAGQKLGRKGRDTRERILVATLELIEEMGEVPISMSAVGPPM